MFIRALADHRTTVQSQSVYSTCVHTTGCTTQSEIKQENWHERPHCRRGATQIFDTSEYIDEVIEVDELNEGNLSAAAGELK